MLGNHAMHMLAPGAFARSVCGKKTRTGLALVTTTRAEVTCRACVKILDALDKKRGRP